MRYDGAMDNMISIPKDCPNRRPLLLVAILGVTALMFLVLFLR